MAKIFMVIAVGLFFLSITCSPKETPVARTSGLAAPETGESQRSSPAAREAWEVEWEKTLKEGQKEGSVIVYVTGIGSILKESIPLFRQKYGINLELIVTRGAEAGPKLLRERANGLFMADVLSAGLNSIYSLKQARVFDPMEPVLILPEVVDSKLWHGDKLPWADKERLIFSFYKYTSLDVTINTQMVRPEEIKSLRDFLEPRWKGKFAIDDPTVTGSPFNQFSTLIFHKTLDLDFFRQLVKQEPAILRDHRLLVDWVARGKYPAGLWARPADASEYQQAGAPIMIYSSKEWTSLSSGGGNLVLLNRAPHPNAARIFINWLLSKEMQLTIQNYTGQQSAREDIPTDGLTQTGMRKPGVKYVVAANEIEEWVLQEQDKYLELARQVFAPLIK